MFRLTTVKRYTKKQKNTNPTQAQILVKFVFSEIFTLLF